MNINDLTVKQICNCIAVINKLKEEKIIKFDINKASVVFNYDKATKYLEEQNIKQQEQLEAYENMKKELINFIEEHKIKDYYGMEFINTDINNLLNILNKVGGDNETV